MIGYASYHWVGFGHADFEGFDGDYEIEQTCDEKGAQGESQFYFW